MKLQIAGAAILGDREEQEDSFHFDEEARESDGYLLILCDGMGGHVGGAYASRLVVDEFRRAFWEARDRLPELACVETAVRAQLHAALSAAHTSLQLEIRERDAPSDMGTTLVAVFVCDRDVHWISVGDSHLYHFTAGRLVKLNADHSMGAVLDELAEIGRISRDEALTDPNRNALRSCVSEDEIGLVDLHSKASLLNRGDALLLASDGLDTLSVEEVTTVLRQRRDRQPGAKLHKLLQRVEDRSGNGQDNTSLLIALAPRRRLFRFG
ncbi:MAG: protein phosphatase 2C domain-containing protein [Pseudomonadota bacterium]